MAKRSNLPFQRRVNRQKLGDEDDCAVMPPVEIVGARSRFFFVCVFVARQHTGRDKVDIRQVFTCAEAPN